MFVLLFVLSHLCAAIIWTYCCLISRTQILHVLFVFNGFSSCSSFGPAISRTVLINHILLAAIWVSPFYSYSLRRDLKRLPFVWLLHTHQALWPHFCTAAAPRLTCSQFLWELLLYEYVVPLPFPCNCQLGFMCLLPRQMCLLSEMGFSEVNNSFIFVFQKLNSLPGTYWVFSKCWSTSYLAIPFQFVAYWGLLTEASQKSEQRAVCVWGWGWGGVALNCCP